MKLALLVAAALSLRAQGGLDYPRVGEILDTAGSVRELRGLAGAFTLGPSKHEGVISIGCNGRICLAKTPDQIVSESGVEAAPAGPALFGFDADQALVYFPETRQFARWSNSSLTMLDWRVDGQVLAIRPRGDEAEIVVRHNDQVWIASVSGQLRGSLKTPPLTGGAGQTQLPAPGVRTGVHLDLLSVAGPLSLPPETVAALLLPPGVVYTTAGAIIIGGHKRIDVEGVDALYQLNPTHAIAHAGRRLFLLAIDRGEIFELPGGEP